MENRKKATSVMTPNGLARVRAEGALTLHSLDTGTPFYGTGSRRASRVRRWAPLCTAPVCLGFSS